MFERFGQPAKKLFEYAVAEAREAGDALIEEEHLAYALFHDPEGEATRLCGGEVTLGTLKAAYAKAHRRGGMSDVEAAALLELGIDVDTVVDSLTSGIDPRALRPPRKGAAARRFSQGARRTLVRTLREAKARKESVITEKHMLLALLRANGLTAKILEGLGVRYTDVHARIA